MKRALVLLMSLLVVSGAVRCQQPDDTAWEVASIPDHWHTALRLRLESIAKQPLLARRVELSLNFLLASLSPQGMAAPEQAALVHHVRLGVLAQLAADQKLLVHSVEMARHAGPGQLSRARAQLTMVTVLQDTIASAALADEEQMTTAYEQLADVVTSLPTVLADVLHEQAAQEAEVAARDKLAARMNERFKKDAIAGKLIVGGILVGAAGLAGLMVLLLARKKTTMPLSNGMVGHEGRDRAMSSNSSQSSASPFLQPHDGPAGEMPALDLGAQPVADEVATNEVSVQTTTVTMSDAGVQTSAVAASPSEQEVIHAHVAQMAKSLEVVTGVATCEIEAEKNELQEVGVERRKAPPDLELAVGVVNVAVEPELALLGEVNREESDTRGKTRAPMIFSDDGNSQKGMPKKKDTMPVVIKVYTPDPASHGKIGQTEGCMSDSSGHPRYVF